MNATTIVATFPTALSASCNDTILPAPSVANARRAGVQGGVLTNTFGTDALLPSVNAPQGTNMPNAANGGATNIASLSTAVLNTSSGNQVSFNFDHPINTVSVTDPSQYHVVLSNGDEIDASSLSQGGPNTVVATFDGLNFADEYGVQAIVDRNAAAATTGCTTNAGPNTPPFPPNGGGTPPFTCGSDGTNTYENSPGSVAIGGNPGAFARGFTTGPDVYMVSFNRTTNVVSLFLDQRPTSVPGGVAGIRLIDANGSTVGTPVSGAIPVFPNPGPVQVAFDVLPSVMALNPIQVQLFNPSGAFPAVVSGVGGFCEFANAFVVFDGCSVPQVVQQTGSGVGIAPIAHSKHVIHIKRTKHVKHVSKHHKARKSHKH